jgi:hypothetical protein
VTLSPGIRPLRLAELPPEFAAGAAGACVVRWTCSIEAVSTGQAVLFGLVVGLFGQVAGLQGERTLAGGVNS